MNRWSSAILLIAIAIMLVLLIMGGLEFPLQFVLILLAGWFFFLLRVIPQIEFDNGAILLSSGALLLFGIGLHLLLKWCYSAADPHRRWRIRWTVSFASLTLLMFVAGISFVGVTHQIAWLMTSKDPLVSTRGFGNSRGQSGNNLKQLALGMEAYHDGDLALPPGATIDAEGRLLHSWTTLILPYCEQRPLYDQIDLRQPWDSPVQGHVFKTRIKYLESPYSTLRNMSDAQGRPVTHYSSNVHVLGGTAPRSMTAITDGTAHTILAGEAGGNYVAWGQPGNWRDPALGVNRSPAGFGSPSSRGAMFAFADGRVQLISADVSPEVLRALATPSGGEQVPDDLRLD